MHLREDEQLLKIYHHHPTPFVLDILKVIVATLPFFLVLFILQEAISTRMYFIIHIIIFIIFSLVILYMSLIFWLDRLVITNQRIIYINWRHLSVRDEAEAFHNEIEEIVTREKGVLAYFKIFDYGYIRVETAAAHVAIDFHHAPDPEGIRQFIYHIRKQ